MNIIIIAAASENNVIGNKGKIPWDLPDDLKHFRSLTEGHPIIMGRKTFESLGRPLPKRKNIVVTHSDRTFEGCEVVHSLEDALKVCAGEPEVWVIGGGEIYREAMAKADRIELTRVHAQVDGDAFFLKINDSHWRLVKEEPHPADAAHQYAFTFQTLERKR